MVPALSCAFGHVHACIAFMANKSANALLRTTLLQSRSKHNYNHILEMHQCWSTIQNGIQFLYKVCMKLRREYIGNIILHLAEFGMKALDIWQSTHLLIFESPQMGLGGKDPGAGDEVELFKQWTTQIQIQIQNWRQGWVGRSRSWRWGGTIPNHPPHTDPPSLIC